MTTLIDTFEAGNAARPVGEVVANGSWAQFRRSLGDSSGCRLFVDVGLVDVTVLDLHDEGDTAVSSDSTLEEDFGYKHLERTKLVGESEYESDPEDRVEEEGASFAELHGYSAKHRAWAEIPRANLIQVDCADGLLEINVVRVTGGDLIERALSQHGCSLDELKQPDGYAYLKLASPVQVRDISNEVFVEESAAKKVFEGLSELNSKPALEHTNEEKQIQRIAGILALYVLHDKASGWQNNVIQQAMDEAVNRYLGKEKYGEAAADENGNFKTLNDLGGVSGRLSSIRKELQAWMRSTGVIGPTDTIKGRKPEESGGKVSSET